MRVTAQDRQEAEERLREWLQPGDTVYTILRHVSRSGMLRYISPVLLKERPYHLDYAVGQYLDRSIGKHDEGVRCDGAGMDMGFDLVYSLSRSLFGDGYALKQAWL